MGSRLLLVLLSLAVTAPALTAHAAEPGPFLGERYRFDEMPILKRLVYDVAAIPANVPSWGVGDWAQLAFWGSAVTVLMYPADPSLDVRLDTRFREGLSGRTPLVWTDPMQITLWGGVIVGGLGTWWWAMHTGHRDVWQGMSLMGEALAVTQVYHLTFKFLLGRDGPGDGDGQGRFLGPMNAFRVYPAGTPSGHAGTLYSMMAAGFAYFDPPWWVQGAGHLLVGSVVAFHVVDLRHFASESLWGAAMGWYVGRWVVRHRASWKFGDAPREAPDDLDLAVVPIVAGGTGGLALAGRF
jgi:hypothetical protein